MPPRCLARPATYPPASDCRPAGLVAVTGDLPALAVAVADLHAYATAD